MDAEIARMMGVLDEFMAVMRFEGALMESRNSFISIRSASFVVEGSSEIIARLGGSGLADLCKLVEFRVHTKLQTADSNGNALKIYFSIRLGLRP